MIQEVSQQALDLNYDGLIIETHNDPDNAWSDAAQQVTPDRLKEIVEELKVKYKNSENVSYQTEIAQLRTKIDASDSKLLEIIGQRMQISEAIGNLKKENKIAVLQNQRWMEILDRMKEEGSNKGLSEEFILNFFKAIHQESISHQEKVINK